MNENSKTIVFVVVACVAVLLAFVTKPRFAPVEQEDMRGKQLFPDFTDALSATGLEIVKFDEATGKVQPFEVEQVKGVWSIPSHEDYPADAKDQLADVAADMVDLNILEQASDSRGDQELYGVVDPDPQKLKPGSTGVGTKVKMWGEDKKELMSLIIGKKVPDQDELRYVRKPDRDQIYVVKVDTEKLTTQFQKWIEDDLLKLNPFDITGLEVQDYSVDLTADMSGSAVLQIAQRGRFAVDYNDTGDPRWKLGFLEKYAGEKEGFVPEPPPAGEVLNTEKLGAMKTALDDLKIVDVARKPKGLSADLRADEGLAVSQETRTSLASRGFYLAGTASGQVGLFSNQGEVRVQMKDGVQYVLRFGEIATGTGSIDDKKKEGDDKKDGANEDGEKEKDADAQGSGLNRYLLVMAEFNEDAIPKPDLEPLPLGKPDKQPAETKPAEAAPAPAAETPAPADGGKETVVEKPVEEKADVEKPAGDKPAEDKPAAETKPVEEKPAADAAKAETPPAEEKPAAEAPKEPAEGAKPEETKPAEASEPKVPAEEPKPEATKSPEDLKKERERIERDNKRKEEEYQEKVKKGKERVKELNDRFADWYYVISDEVYQKIHLTRDDLFKPEEKKPAADGTPAAGDFSPAALDQLRRGLPKP